MVRSGRDSGARFPAPLPPRHDLPVGVGPDGVDRRGTVEVGRVQSWMRTSIRERRLGRYLERAADGVAEILHHRAVGPDEHGALEHVAIAPSGVWLIAVIRAPVIPDGADSEQIRVITEQEQARLAAAAQAMANPSRVHDTLATIGFDWVSVRPCVCVEGRADLTAGDGITSVSRRRLAKKLLGPGQLRPHDIRTVAAAMNERLPLLDLGPSRH